MNYLSLATRLLAAFGFGCAAAAVALQAIGLACGSGG
jgi:hypothetical protein